MGNEFEYLNDTIARETAYSEGYDAGKQAGREEVFAAIDELLAGFSITTEPAQWYLDLKKKFNIEHTPSYTHIQK